MGIPRNHPKFDHFRIETVVVGIPLILRNLHWYCCTVLGLYCLRITVVWYNNVIALHNIVFESTKYIVRDVYNVR